MDEATSSDVSSTVLTTAAPELVAFSPVTVPSPVWARPYASGGRRAAFAQISLGVTVAIFALAAWLDLLTMMIAATAGPLLTDDQFTLIDQLQVALTVVWLAALVIAAIAFLVWIHRAYRNLPAVCTTGLNSSPARSLGRPRRSAPSSLSDESRPGRNKRRRRSRERQAWNHHAVAGIRNASPGRSRWSWSCSCWRDRARPFMRRAATQAGLRSG